jgi:hypothetical protein
MKEEIENANELTETDSNVVFHSDQCWFWVSRMADHSAHPEPV